MSSIKAIAYILGVLLVVAFIVAIPQVFAVSPNWVAGFAVLLVLVALVRTVSDALMGEIERTPRRLAKQFAAVFVATSFQIGIIVFILPAVAMQLIWVFAAMGAVVTFIGTTIGVLQLYAGVDLGASIQRYDIVFTLVILNCCFCILGLGLLISAYFEKNENYDGFFAYIGMQYERLMRFLTT